MRGRLLYFLPLRCFNLVPRPLGPVYLGYSLLKRNITWAQPPPRGQILSITDLLTPMPLPYPPLTCQRSEAGWASGKRGRGDANPAPPPTLALSLPHPRGRPELESPGALALRPFPSSGSQNPYGAKAPNSSTATPGVPTSYVPGAGKQRGCSGVQPCAPRGPPPSFGGAAGSLGQPGPVQPRHEDPA